jgi:hypothetical protein
VRDTLITQELDQDVIQTLNESFKSWRATLMNRSPAGKEIRPVMMATTGGQLDPRNQPRNSSFFVRLKDRSRTLLWESILSDSLSPISDLNHQPEFNGRKIHQDVQETAAEWSENTLATLATIVTKSNPAENARQVLEFRDPMSERDLVLLPENCKD